MIQNKTLPAQHPPVTKEQKSKHTAPFNFMWRTEEAVNFFFKVSCSVFYLGKYLFIKCIETMYFVCNASALISPKAKNESVWQQVNVFLKHNFFVFLATIVLFLFVFSFACPSCGNQILQWWQQLLSEADFTAGFKDCWLKSTHTSVMSSLLRCLITNNNN